jgi:hypothetical protein
MRSIQTSDAFPLSSVKPLEGLLSYRAYCLAATHKALQGPTRRCERCPVEGTPLQDYGTVEGLGYAQCPQCRSLFLAALPQALAWARLLEEVSRYRRMPAVFHANLARSRTDHVYGPKLEWIKETLRLQQMVQPSVLEVVSPPSEFTELLRDGGVCADVETVNEMDVAAGASRARGKDAFHVALLMESLDRVDDPQALLGAVRDQLIDGGLLFVTGLVASGFDLAVLGVRNLYLCPPDRTNCFSLQGLSSLITRAGFTLLEVSTPGVLDVEIVQAHFQRDPSLPLSAFERQLLAADADTQRAFQEFLQAQGLSSFARLVGRKGA